MTPLGRTVVAAFLLAVAGTSTAAAAAPAVALQSTGSPVPSTVLLGGLAVLLGLVVALVARARSGRERSAAGRAAPTRADPDELLTDEERVHRLLEANDGRLPQAAIVEQTEWSKAKVSRLLSRMDEEGEVTKISVGRRNLIALPGEEPEHARVSPED